jgi:hypothetical protein
VQSVSPWRQGVPFFDSWNGYNEIAPSIQDRHYRGAEKNIRRLRFFSGAPARHLVDVPFCFVKVLDAAWRLRLNWFNRSLIARRQERLL